MIDVYTANTPNGVKVPIALEELGRVDGSVRGFVAVHVGLVAQTVAKFGTEAQRAQWVPRLAAGADVTAVNGSGASA